jgi:LemA protein
MSMPLFLILVLIAVGGYVWFLYNELVTIKTRIRASIQEIGNQLKRQAELIPNLIASVKGYMKHEKEIFDELTEARKQVMEVVGSTDAQKMVEAGNRLQQALAPIRAVFESTPQLQAAEPTTKLMDELRDTSDKVMYARRTLIDLTADYNIKILTFPSNLVAKILGFKEEAGLVMPEGGQETKVSLEETETPKVEL